MINYWKYIILIFVICKLFPLVGFSSNILHYVTLEYRLNVSFSVSVFCRSPRPIHDVSETPMVKAETSKIFPLPPENNTSNPRQRRLGQNFKKIRRQSLLIASCVRPQELGTNWLY